MTERGDSVGGGATAFGAKFPFLHLLSIPIEEFTWASVYRRVAARGVQLVQVRVTAAPRAPEAEAVGSGGLAPSFMKLRRPVSVASSGLEGPKKLFFVDAVIQQIFTKRLLSEERSFSTS